jgi:hypothetical protein
LELEYDSELAKLDLEEKLEFWGEVFWEEVEKLLEVELGTELLEELELVPKLALVETKGVDARGIKANKETDVEMKFLI